MGLRRNSANITAEVRLLFRKHHFPLNSPATFPLLQFSIMGSGTGLLKRFHGNRSTHGVVEWGTWVFTRDVFNLI